MSWIQTYTGKKFTPFAPRPEDVCIEDIAHALSMLCRFGGHVSEFYSVADHSIRVALECNPEYRLLGLLHDASEAYLVDVPRPIKQKIDLYREVEANVQGVICQRFGLPLIWPNLIHEIDNRMLLTEAKQLCYGSIWSEFNIKAEPYSTFGPVRSQSEAKREFLQLFTQFSTRS
jgi:uncharacterized protein